MIADLKPYPAYKDSGSQWIAQVPEHWEVRNLRTLIRPRNERNRVDLPLLSVARERGVFVRSMTDASENHNIIPLDLSNYKVASAGSLVINKMKAWQGSMGIAPCDGIVSPAYYVYDFAIADRKFGQALLRSKPYVAHFGQASDGVRVGQWDLTIAAMRQIPLLAPPPEEQAAIVKFLDWSNARLERTIRAKRRVIGLLTEQKQAIIHRAVTRGLDPNVSLKPSGIAWLGDIPAHWEPQSLGRSIRLITGFPFASSGFASADTAMRLVRGINVTPNGLRWNSVVRWERKPGDGLDDFALQVGDIVLGMDRPIIGSGVRASPVVEKDVPSLLLQRVARLRPTSKLEANFLLMLLRGRLFADYMEPIFTGISVPHLSPEQIKRFKVALPPVHEQSEIVRYVESETRGLDNAISRLNREMDLLREYRTRLVSDVVTGKLDVREAAARLPHDEVEAALEHEVLDSMDTADAEAELEE